MVPAANDTTVVASSWLSTRRAFAIVALVTVVTQIVSAGAGIDKTIQPVNAAQEIADHLRVDGRYEGGNWVRLKGVVRPDDPPLRAFNLPGYVWYLDVVGRAPPAFRRYAQIPVIVLLTLAIAGVAAALGGPALGLVSGLVAALDPFVVVHGPVLDDAVYETALVWAIGAVAMRRWSRGADTARAPSGCDAAVVVVLAALAALTRLEAQLVLVALALVVWMSPILRRWRAIAVVAVVSGGLAVAGWGLRNERAIGVFDAGSTHDGITLWESNGAESRRALALGQVDHLSQDSSVMAAVWQRTAQMSEAEADAYFRREAIRYIIGHPGDVGLTALDKLAVSIAGLRPEQSPFDLRNVVSLIDAAALLLLATAALVRLARPPFDTKVSAVLASLAILGVVTLGLLVIGPAGIRYWLTLRGALWILAAERVLRWHRGRRAALLDAGDASTSDRRCAASA
jgi:hypothetical protein